jgi:hypothetical protein
MFGHSILPEPGQGSAVGFVPLAACSPAPLPQWRMAEFNAPAKQPPRDYGAEVRIPQADRITRALLDAIF